MISPVDKRKRDWCVEIERALADLAQHHQCSPAGLAEDPAFVSALLKATATALATHQKKKLFVLREFLVAVGSRAIPDEETQHALLRLLDDLSVGHLEVLQFLKAEADAIGSLDNLDAVYERYRAAYRGQLDRMTFRWLLADLTSRMVIHLGDITDMDEFASQKSFLLLQSSKQRPLQITALGERLLQLLSAPT